MRRLSWVLALAMLAAPACTVTYERRREPPRSLTSRITADPSASHDMSRLLTEADARAVAGLEGVTAQELGNAPLFEDPDPRGPCGAKVPALPSAGLHGRVFSADGITAFQMLVPATAVSLAALDATIADVRPSCGPYTSTTNTGAVQRVGDIQILTMPPGCARCSGRLATIAVSGKTLYFGGVVFESGGTICSVGVMSETKVPARVVLELFDRARSRLGS